MSPSDAPDQSTPMVLADPVRQRLLQVAAGVVGRMPAEEVPPTLRPIARFTAAKRIRLGATALSAALDADPDFRKRVADAVAESSPQLVDAVQNGEPTTASDPLDTAVVAYLIRPDGWAELLAEVTGRWTSEQSARDAAAEEIGRVRAELAEARARLKAQHAELDDAVAAATAAASSEATRLRNLLRTRTGELRAAEAAVDAARSDLDRARAELAAARTGQEAALSALRARVHELERAGESARRDTRTERDVAEAKLRLLLDTLTEAAAGVRRELALPAGTLRPADALGTGDQPGRPQGAAPELDRLLELPQVHLIIDGYNVTKTGYGDLPLADQRSRLIAALAALRARSGGEITVVFDGGARPPAQPRTPRGIRVLFSAPDEIADDLIRRLVAAEPAGRPLVVVTSDRAIVTDVTRAGAWAVPSATLLDRLG
ncbi:MAG TPA: NYN domain-containing protein [Jatrophihabitans sp.]|jgi:predicted RNA-binding protein with PIN domain